jgi:hypothetical protein
MRWSIISLRLMSNSKSLQEVKWIKECVSSLSRCNFCLSIEQFQFVRENQVLCVFGVPSFFLVPPTPWQLQRVHAFRTRSGYFCTCTQGFRGQLEATDICCSVGISRFAAAGREGGSTHGHLKPAPKVVPSSCLVRPISGHITCQKC